METEVYLNSNNLSLNSINLPYLRETCVLLVYMLGYLHISNFNRDLNLNKWVSDSSGFDVNGEGCRATSFRTPWETGWI